MNPTAPPSRARDFLVAIRVHQWIKNLIIPFVGIVMAAPNPDWEQLALSLLMAFAGFCLAASSIYLLNDMMDVHKDRSHPVKRWRPIASGRLSTPFLWLALAVAIPASLGLGWEVGPKVAALLLAYLAINVGYCIKFKHVPQLDVVCVASGFTIRALIGALAVGRSVDFWLLAAITFACMGLALMKRMKELKKLGASANTRPVLAGYNHDTLQRAHDMFMVLAVLSLMIFLEHSTKTSNNPMTVAACLTFISALLLVFIHRVHSDSDGDPTTLIYRNKFTSLAVLLTFLSFFLLLR